MRKRLLAGMLILTMLVCLVACGSKEEESSSRRNRNKKTEENVEENEPTEQPAITDQVSGEIKDTGVGGSDNNVVPSNPDNNTDPAGSGDNIVPAETDTKTYTDEDFGWQTFYDEYTDSDGYTISKSIKVSGWMKADDTDLINAAWKVVGKNKTFSATPSEMGFHNGKIYLTTTSATIGTYNWMHNWDEVVYAVGFLEIENLTENYSITSSDTHSLYVNFGTVKYSTVDPMVIDFGNNSAASIKLYYSEPKVLYALQNGGYYAYIHPKMTSDHWGVPFILAFPVDKTPNAPEGDPDPKNCRFIFEGQEFKLPATWDENSMAEIKNLAPKEAVTVSYTDYKYQVGSGIYTSEINDSSFEDPYDFNKDLAMACGIMSRAAEDENGEGIKKIYKEQFGISDKDILLGDSKGVDHYGESLSYSVAGKDIGSNKVLIVTARGSMTPYEFVSDFTTSVTKDNFLRQYTTFDLVNDFQNYIWTGIETYLDKHPEYKRAKNLKVLVCGHSLGGAAANLVAARMILLLRRGEYLSDIISPEDIYCYTFGAIDAVSQYYYEKLSPLPNLNGTYTVKEIECSYKVPIESGFENIHNIYNEKDSFSTDSLKVQILDVLGDVLGIPGGKAFTTKGKFGHIDKFSHDFGEEILNTMNHDMIGYMAAVRDGYVGHGTQDTVIPEITDIPEVTDIPEITDIPQVTDIPKEIASEDLGRLVESVSASSTLEEKTITHYPENVLDGKKNTCWCEAAEGYGKDEYIMIRFSKKVALTELDFVNGYMSKETTYNKNAKLAKIKIVYDGGSKVAVLKDLSYSEASELDYTDSVIFDEPVETDYVQIYIKSVYEGTIYEDTCVSEIRAMGYEPD